MLAEPERIIMNNLNEAREKINSIDKDIAKLFEDRMSLCKDIAEFKKANSLPVLDASREEAVVNNNLKLISNEELKPYYDILLGHQLTVKITD